MQYNSVVIFTTGAPGTGKTYSRCARFLYQHWLPERSGVHWSNFPAKIEKFTAKFPDAAERIKIIPQEELDRWARFQSGPWDFFRDKDLEGAHVAIDECHNFIKRHGEGSGRNAQEWEQWLGEIRHRGCTVEFLSQDPHKVHKCVEIHAGVRISLVNSEDRRDPFFSILLGDWYEMRALVSREYETRIWQLEERRVNGRWITSHRETFALTPFYFDFYDSFNRPQSGGGKASGQEREFQKRSPVGLLCWFARRNLWRLASRTAIVAVFVWVCFMGGMNWLIFRYMSFSNAMGKAQHRASAVSSAPAEPGKPAEKVSDGNTRETSARIREPVQSTGAEAAVKAKESRADALRIGRALGAGEQKDQVKTGGTKHGAHEEPGYVLAGVSTDWAAMGDGRMLRAGEAVNECELVRVEYRLRGAIFRVAGKEHLVCVGGSVR
jgi:hypothetical protein